MHGWTSIHFKVNTSKSSVIGKIQLNNWVIWCRCQCHLKLGHFADARQDALKVLEVDPYVTKGLIVMAESEYHLGNFERALMYFHRWGKLGRIWIFGANASAELKDGGVKRSIVSAEITYFLLVWLFVGSFSEPISYDPGMAEFRKASTSLAMQFRTRFPCKLPLNHEWTSFRMECLFDRRHGFSFTDWKDVINAMLNEGTYGMDEEQIKLMKLGFATAVAVSWTDLQTVSLKIRSFRKGSLTQWQ